MKLRSIILGLCVLFLSSISAQEMRKNESQRGNMMEPQAPNRRGFDRNRSFQIDYNETLDGRVQVTTSSNRIYSFTLMNGSLQIAPKMVNQFKRELKQTKSGDVYSFAFENGVKVEMVRTKEGWSPVGGGSPNYDERSLLPCTITVIVITLWLLVYG